MLVGAEYVVQHADAAKKRCQSSLPKPFRLDLEILNAAVEISRIMGWVRASNDKFNFPERNISNIRR